MSKVKVGELKCFGQVANVIGKAQAQIELFNVLSVAKECVFEDKKALSDAFIWDDAPQGYQFWAYIDYGINPYDN